MEKQSTTTTSEREMGESRTSNTAQGAASLLNVAVVEGAELLEEAMPDLDVSADQGDHGDQTENSGSGSSSTVSHTNNHTNQNNMNDTSNNHRSIADASVKESSGDDVLQDSLTFNHCNISKKDGGSDDGDDDDDDTAMALEFTQQLSNKTHAVRNSSNGSVTKVGDDLSPSSKQRRDSRQKPSVVSLSRGSDLSRRVSLMSQAVVEAGHKACHPSRTAEQYLDPTRIQENQFWQHTLALFASLQLVAFGICLTLMYPTVVVTCPLTLLSMATMSVIVRLTDLSTQGERIMTLMGLVMVLFSCSSTMMLVTRPCSHCLVHWARDAMSSSHEISSLQKNTGSGDLNLAWQLLLSEEERPDTVMGSCRQCVSDFVTFVEWPRQYFFPVQEVDDEQIAQEEKALFNISTWQTSESMFGDLASWYLYHVNRTTPRDLSRFNRKFANALSDQGYFNNESLTETLTEYLCSSASRFDSPDPNRFLSNIKTPRFTGEKPLNISAAALQSIMRGDLLKEMGAPVCFMLRFALFVPADYELESKPIQYTTLMPSMNEEQMRSADYSTALPFLITPGLDQDIDVNSRDMNRFKSLMDIFTRFPYEKKKLYFSTKDEYMAFFRWELEGTIQDSFYFPTWYQHTEKAAAQAEFRAKRTKVSNDHLALQDSTSDKTLGDRCFFGAGQRFMTPIKIPGLDEDYEFIFPEGPHSYHSQEHRDTNALRFSHKPRASDLLMMIYNFWPKEEKRNKKRDHIMPLARFKNRVAEIDFAVFAALPSREDWHSPGVILYLDPKSKLPMGVWKASTREMILPNEGLKWEHAKFYYRVTERAAVATLHVIESHYGYSQSVATASWQTFHKDHPLRTLLKPFTLNVHSVNWAAFHMLIRENSVLTHGSSFSTEGVAGTMTTFWKTFNFSQSLPEQFDSRKMDQVMDTDALPLYSQGKRLYKVHRHFVNRFVDTFYPTDEDLLDDVSVVRFWHHVNTYGRHLDPCVCGMDPNVFFDDNNVWPGFEKTRTCSDLLDTMGFAPEKNPVTRRRDWCSSTDRYEKTKAVHQMNVEICASNPDCKRLFWDATVSRPDMSMGQLTSKAQLIDFIATFIFHVSASHALNSDNVSFFSDPEYSGVRMVDDIDGELPRIIDVGTYVFGNTVGMLTSVRCPPLMSDWRPLYSHFVTRQADLSTNQKESLLKDMENIHKEYKFALFDLSVEFLDESTARPLNRRSNAMNPSTHASSVSV